MTKLEEYLKADRQWRRDQRIQHAKYQLRRLANMPNSGEEKKFWKAVFKANAYEKQQ